jgi:hypothetical protein
VIIIDLLKQSMATNMESALHDSDRSVTKSIVIECQIPIGTGFGCKGTLVRGLFFVDWQTA